MKLGLLLNRGLSSAGESTQEIAAALKGRGHSVLPLPIQELELSQRGRLLSGEQDLNELDAVLIRTSPGRDQARGQAHHLALDLLARLDGPLVLNNPRALQRTGSKLWLTDLPEELRPLTWMTRSPDRVRSILSELGEVVVKPLTGSGGRGVVRLDSARADQASAIVELLAEQGPVLVQEVLPGAEEGDIRVLVLGGRVLGAVRRRPGSGEFRSNVSRGGQPEEARLSRDQQRAVRALAQEVHRAGIWLAGLDLIGTKAVEINVFSPGGFADAGGFVGRDLIRDLCDNLEQRVKTWKRTGT